MSEFKEISLPVAEIEASSAIQVRYRIDHHTVKDYAEAIAAGAIMPPLVVFAEQGSERYLLADGFHRLAALKICGIEEVACHKYVGGIHEALAYAMGANDTHGLRRNNKDKRNAVMMALKDPEWSTWSAADISLLCRVDPKTVVKVREELVLAGDIDAPETVQYTRGNEVVERKSSSPRTSGNPEVKDSSAKSKTSQTPEQRKTARHVRESLRPKPRSQDEVNRDEFFASLTAIRAIPYDGAEAVRRWQCEDKLDELVYIREWADEAINAILQKSAA